MKRRDFLKQTAIAASASLLLESVRTDGYRLVGAAFAGSNGDDQKATLEQKFAEFAIFIRYEALPVDVVASAKRVLLDTLGCAFGSVGSEPANIAETTIRKTFGDGNTATVIGYPRPATVEGALFVNGVLVRSLDLNDTYIGTEPLCCRRRLRSVKRMDEAAAISSKRWSPAMRPACASMTPSPSLNGVSIPCVRPRTASL